MDVTGEAVTSLIPSMEWPDEREGRVARFTSTGRIDEDTAIPLSCVVTRGEAGSLRAGVWVYSSLSGLVILDSQGCVTRCDETFASTEPLAEAERRDMERIEACLEADPSRRASLWFVKEHHWLSFPAYLDNYRFSDVISDRSAHPLPGNVANVMTICGLKKEAFN